MRDINEYQFVIPGACPPKGSKVPVRKGSSTMREASTRVAPWTENAIRAMQDSFAQPRARFEGPVYVVPTFVFRRPEVTESEFPVAPTIGDLDKLVRCLLDAMTKAKVIEDDRFVVDLGDDNGGRPRKHWGPADVTMVRVGRVLTDRQKVVDVFQALGVQAEDWQLRALERVEGIRAHLGGEVQGRALNPYQTTEVRGGPCECAGRCAGLNVCKLLNPYAQLPPPVPVQDMIDVTTEVEFARGQKSEIPGLVDLGACPRCSHALRPGDNGSGVKCSSGLCDYWFCY